MVARHAAGVIVIAGVVFLLACPPTGPSIKIVEWRSAVTVGRTLQLVAQVYDAAGTQLPGIQLQWTSNNPALASVNSNGLVTGVALGGPVTITGHRACPPTWRSRWCRTCSPASGTFARSSTVPTLDPRTRRSVGLRISRGRSAHHGGHSVHGAVFESTNHDVDGGGHRAADAAHCVLPEQRHCRCVALDEPRLLRVAFRAWMASTSSHSRGSCFVVRALVAALLLGVAPGRDPARLQARLAWHCDHARFLRARDPPCRPDRLPARPVCGWQRGVRRDLQPREPWIARHPVLAGVIWATGYLNIGIGCAPTAIAQQYANWNLQGANQFASDGFTTQPPPAVALTADTFKCHNP